MADLRVLSGWLDSTQGLVLALLAALGLLFLVGQSEWETGRKAEFYLCAWLVGGLGLYLMTAHPTFDQYFILLLPFVSILASVGLYAIGSRALPRKRPSWLVLAVAGVFVAGLAKAGYLQRHSLHCWWRETEDIAREINRVTPREGLVYSDYDVTYFAARRLPPSGLEHHDAQKLHLAPALAASLQVVTDSQVDEWLSAGRFDTVSICATEQRMQSLGLPRLYAQRKSVGGCDIFWEKAAGRNAPN